MTFCDITATGRNRVPCDCRVPRCAQVNYPLCTLADTPRNAAHCIQWAKLIQWPIVKGQREPDMDQVDDVQWLFERAQWQHFEIFNRKKNCIVGQPQTCRGVSLCNPLDDCAIRLSCQSSPRMSCICEKPVIDGSRHHCVIQQVLFGSCNTRHCLTQSLHLRYLQGTSLNPRIQACGRVRHRGCDTLQHARSCEEHHPCCRVHERHRCCNGMPSPSSVQ